jgi:DNA-binding Lrp family transcriptional regulator
MTKSNPRPAPADPPTAGPAFSLDAIDRQLLAALSLDARASLTELAARLHISKQVASYRLKVLQQAGVIRGFHAIPNVHLLGKMHYRIFVKFQHMTEEREQALLAELGRCREIAWLTVLDGDFDLEFVIWAGDILEFEAVYDSILARFGAHFQEKYFSIATRVEYLPYRFLGENASSPALLFGGRLAETKLDDLDRIILTHLNRDGRLPLARLAASCRVAAPLVRSRLENLLERRIILGFGLKIDHGRIGFIYHKVLLQLSRHTAADIARLSDFLRRERNVIFLVKTIGTYDYEFEMMNESNDEFFRTLKRIRSHFAAEIELHQTMVVYDELKYGQLQF